MRQKRRKINWLKIEADIHQALRVYAAGEITAIEACRVVDAVLAHGTGRGAALPVEPLPWEDSRSEDAARKRVPEWYE